MSISAPWEDVSWQVRSLRRPFTTSMKRCRMVRSEASTQLPGRVSFWFGVWFCRLGRFQPLSRGPMDADFILTPHCFLSLQNSDRRCLYFLCRKSLNYCNIANGRWSESCMQQQCVSQFFLNNDSSLRNFVRRKEARDLRSVRTRGS